ncbi:MAG: molybdopterin-dependent oxidoreductase [Alphaproteobacteria bacterium]|nr:molybdopterin-dependent oxidoreductase [Alphaproteobacteria bacterium]MBU1525089.1 molybdopterin-dependent oxidoreductase [Alphaproteobacteria bacterium]MBU2116300.1 molybdopterin-dependent oxidoreductase [Alphaproteobacteria bacterium]MBU2351325.1 molybdopterin-dependent oxidoreductase [Alphaproteobacteria bacterium]MBU2381480.1 molybdopterin-dependent oxidoreductase [Alphaproteobacteria bacterium]
MIRPDRRLLILGGAAALSGCDALVRNPAATCTVKKAEGLTRGAQRAVIPRTALAPEYTEREISKDFKANGSLDPADREYRALRANGFRDYRLIVDGLVDRPLSLSMADIKRRPSRTQITKHDCVEGWTSIGKWKGARLSAILNEAGLKPNAKYIMFYCFDALDQREDGERYYTSIDLVDAFHAQTLLAYEMNDQPLPIKHGAPIRLRAERQLGYKMAKYIKRIEAVESFAHIGKGKGGYWEDRGYEWYAGI